MSFPTIPDIDPHINVKFEDAIHLLATSIAKEEESISKLMDAETSKILYVLGNCQQHGSRCDGGDCHKGPPLCDVIRINESVDDAIKDLIKLQMLLEFKLDDIKDFFPCPAPNPPTSPCTGDVPECPAPVCAAVEKCCCSLTGTGKGYVPNCCDGFHQQLATLYAFLYSSDLRNRTVRYSAGDDESNLKLRAAGYSVKMRCPACCSGELVIYGKGTAEKNSPGKPGCPVQADFVLTVGRKVPDNLEYRMEIKSDKNPEFNHDSGFVQVRDAISSLWFENYFYC